MSRSDAKWQRARGYGRRLVCRDCGRSLGDYLVIEAPDRRDERRFTTLKPTRLPNGMVSWDGTGLGPKMFFKVENAALEPMDENPGSIWRFMPPKYRWRCSCGAGPVVRADSLTDKVSREGDVVV